MEQIQLTKSDIGLFKSFLADKEIKLVNKEESGELVKITYNSDQQFVLDKSLYTEIFKYENDLIFGKDKTERVVSIEIDGDNLVLFIQNEDGTITKEFRENTFWFLSHDKMSSKQTKLEGNQHYSWAALFKSHEEFQKAIKNTWKKDVYTMWDPKEAALVYNGITYFKGLTPKEVSILSFDIETNGLRHTDDSFVYMISNTYRDHKGVTERRLFSCDDFASQKEMIDSWCLWVREKDPSIMLGHNIFGFDILYLAHVAEMHETSLKLGRDGSDIKIRERTSNFRKDGSQTYEYHNALVYGREILDSFFLSIRYDLGRSFPSYGLKPIIKHLGLEKEGRSFIDTSKLTEYYNNRVDSTDMWNKVKQYAIEDADDSLKLFDLMIPSLFYFTQNVSKSFQSMNNSASGSQLGNIMARSYLQIGHSIAKASESNHFEGAISFGIHGVFKNCVRWDAASLYPSIMRQHKIYNKYKDPNAHFLAITNYFALERLKNKKLAKETGDQYYKDLEQSQKVGANSLYGFLGGPGGNYNYPQGAAQVTRIGRELLKRVIFWASGKNLEEITHAEES